MTMPRHSTHSKLIPGLVLIALLGSILACIKPIQKKNPAVQKPEAAAKDAKPASPDASAAPKEDSAPGQLVEVPMSTTERLCEQGQASACVASGRQAVARADEDPQQLSRAAMFLHQACDMGISEACYDYALMVWQRSGAAYNSEEIRFAFELAKRHGSPHATIPYDGLLDALGAETNPDKNTLYHYDQACRLGLQSACSTFAARHDGSALPSPSTQEPRGEQPPAPQPRTALTPAPQPPVVPPTPTPAPKPQVSVTPPAAPVDPPAPVEPPKPVEQPKPVAKPQGPKPMIAERELRVEGALTEESVRKTISPRKSQLIYCYEKEQRQQSELKGDLVIKLTLDGNGIVAETQTNDSTLPSPEALKCMDKLVRMWRFERSGAAQTIVYYRARFDAEMTP